MTSPKAAGLISWVKWNISKANTDLLSWNLAGSAYLPASGHAPSSASLCLDHTARLSTALHPWVSASVTSSGKPSMTPPFIAASPPPPPEICHVLPCSCPPWCPLESKLCEGKECDHWLTAIGPVNLGSLSHSTCSLHVC